MSKLNDILGKYSGQINESIGVRPKDVGTRAITNVKAIELTRIQPDADLDFQLVFLFELGLQLIQNAMHLKPRDYARMRMIRVR